MVRLLARYGATVDRSNKQGWAPLHRAAVNGHAACTRVLLELGAARNPSNLEGNTPLHIAAMGNHLSVIDVRACATARHSGLACYLLGHAISRLQPAGKHVGPRVDWTAGKGQACARGLTHLLMATC
jgi:hypothetical protein